MIEGEENIRGMNNDSLITVTAMPITEAPSLSSSLIDQPSMMGCATPVIEITSPANLPPGYTFRAKLPNGQIIPVTVPLDQTGVIAGEIFTIPFPYEQTNLYMLQSDSATNPNTGGRIPTGKWKHKRCNCCKYGCCHPMLCNALFFPMIGVAQVMTRLNLNWLGVPSTLAPPSRNITFCITLLLLTILLGSIVLFSLDIDENFYFGVLAIVILLYFMYVTIKTRSYIRVKYQIPSKCCGECEDFWAVFFCNCCIVMQMASHTTDYSYYAAYCCTKTGLSNEVNFDHVSAHDNCNENNSVNEDDIEYAPLPPPFAPDHTPTQPLLA